MSRAPLLQRLGLLGGPGETRLAWSLVALGALLYSLGYAAYYPRGATVDDEGAYIEQTLLWLETGSFRMEKLDPLSDQAVQFMPGTYPVGMAALMAPLAAAFGERGVFLASFACLLVALLVTGRWLAEERRSPLFALVLIGFPAAAVAGRLAMSDSARTAAAALGLWLFFRGLDHQRHWWLVSGFLAGAALTLRETATLPFLPLFAGAALRRDRGWAWLLLGGLAGSALHLTLNELAFGEALFVRGSRPFPFEPATAHERLPLYLLGLLVLVPGGLWFGLSYRGRRRPEVVATVALFFLFYLGQPYSMIESGFAKRLVIGLRYFDPLLPVLAFAMAEALPRQLAALLARTRRPARAERLASAAACLWLALCLSTAFAVHPVLGRWSAGQDEIRELVAVLVPRDAVLITNGLAIRKHLDDVGRRYLTLFRNRLTPEDVERLRKRHGSFLIAFVDRSDSAYWREDAAQNEVFLAGLPDATRLLDRRISATDRLRIFSVGRPRGAAKR